MSLDLAPSLRTALAAEAPITGLITEYKGEPAIFTQKPVPSEVSYPYIVISPDVSITDADGLRSDRPIVMRDIITYGHQPEDYRDVEQVAYATRELFHRTKESIISTDYDIILITTAGPRPAPTSDDEIIGRVVTLTIQLEAK